MASNLALFTTLSGGIGGTGIKGGGGLAVSKETPDRLKYLKRNPRGEGKERPQEFEYSAELLGDSRGKKSIRCCPTRPLGCPPETPSSLRSASRSSAATSCREWGGSIEPRKPRRTRLSPKGDRRGEPLIEKSRRRPGVHPKTPQQKEGGKKREKPSPLNDGVILWKGAGEKGETVFKEEGIWVKINEKRTNK